MIDSLLLSVEVTLMAMLAVVPIGGSLGLLLARRQGWLRIVVDALVIIPLVLPPSATGYYLLIFLGANGVVGAWLRSVFGIRLVFTPAGAAAAAAVVSLPLMAKGAEAAFLRVSRSLEDVARANGRSPWQSFRLVTLPLAAPGLAVAMTVAAVRALGEFGATLTFAGYAEGRTSTAPLELYVALAGADDARAGRIAFVLVFVSGLAALVLGFWGRRGGHDA